MKQNISHFNSESWLRPTRFLIRLILTVNQPQKLKSENLQHFSIKYSENHYKYKISIIIYD